MSLPRFALTREPLSVDGISRALERDAQARDEGCGGLCSFVGVVRATHQRRRVRYLEYEAYDALAMKVFAQIDTEIRGHWPDVLVAIHHRTGRLEIGEASVVIVAAAAHRAAAFQASRYAIERVKQIAPIWKHEFFEDGEAWVAGATADPEDAAARQAALERACA
jgi:molybdopterin synthase catalytic subunit